MSNFDKNKCLYGRLKYLKAFAKYLFTANMKLW